MKMTEIKGLETKELAERIESETAKYNQMKRQNSVRENLTNNNGPDGNKKFKKDKTGCRYQQQDG